MVYRGLGDDQKKWMFGAEVTDDGAYLVIEVCENCDPVNQLYVAELTGPVALLPRDSDDNILVNKLFDSFEAGYLCFRLSM